MILSNNVVILINNVVILSNNVVILTLPRTFRSLWTEHSRALHVSQHEMLKLLLIVVTAPYVAAARKSLAGLQGFVREDIHIVLILAVEH